MTPLQVIVTVLAIPALLIAAYLVIVVAIEEVRSWYRPGPDLMPCVWLPEEDPRRAQRENPRRVP